jgi:hypothetical protein
VTATTAVLALAGSVLVGAGGGASPPDPARVRECSASCVESYADALPDGITCIDSCGRGYPNEPTAACSKRCVIRHIKSLPDIRECIDHCGR